MSSPQISIPQMSKMMAWNKSSVIHFFEKHVGRRILIEEPEPRIKICGKVSEVVHQDLCSHTLSESALVLETKGIDVSVTFHDHFVGLHIMIDTPNQATPELSVPYRIPYINLELVLLD